MASSGPQSTEFGIIADEADSSLRPPCRRARREIVDHDYEENMTAVTDRSPTGNEVIFQHPAISLIETGLEPGGFSIYIGGTDAARDVGLLRAHNISIVMNCAVNLDINYVDQTLDKSAGSDYRVFGFAPVSSAHVGMIDGPGNSPAHLISACYLIEAMLHQKLPEKQTYPIKRAGNILVHCRGGRSRSVAVSALYLHLNHPRRWSTIDEALQYVRDKRRIHPNEYYKAPKKDLLVLVRQVLSLRNSGATILP